MKSSHGFLKNFISISKVITLAKKVNGFLDIEKEISNYYGDIKIKVPEVDVLLDEKIKKKVGSLLDTEDPLLSSVELHVQLPNCKPIPPHQDNFYHCINPPEFGVKILVPLSNLNPTNGGLLFLDLPSNFKVIDHIPSSTPSFSSIIPDEIFKKLNAKISSYEYNLGDISFHYLNSIHLSRGNQTQKRTSFLVYRYENKNCSINKISLKKYESCVASHKELIIKSNFE